MKKNHNRYGFNLRRLNKIDSSLQEGDLIQLSADHPWHTVMFLRQSPDSIYTWQSHGYADPEFTIEEKAYPRDGFNGFGPFNILSIKRKGGLIQQFKKKKKMKK